VKWHEAVAFNGARAFPTDDHSALIAERDGADLELAHYRPATDLSPGESHYLDDLGRVIHDNWCPAVPLEDDEALGPRIRNHQHIRILSAARQLHEQPTAFPYQRKARPSATGLVRAPLKPFPPIIDRIVERREEILAEDPVDTGLDCAKLGARVD
jgi:hypothetical protein